MCISAINNSSIENFQDVTCRQVTTIQQLPNILAKEGIYADFIPDEGSRSVGLKDRDIVDLSKRLKTLQVSLNNYRPNLIQRIIDFFIGRYCKKIRLQRSLKTIVDFVSKISRKIHGQNPALGGDDDSLPYSATTIAAKKKLAESVVKLITESLNDDREAGPRSRGQETVEGARKIARFFAKVVDAYSKGKNPALPRYYHATRDYYIDKIMQSGKLKQSSAPKGMGVFFSTNDEGGTGYGPYTFGMDEGAIADADAHYFHGFVGQGVGGNHKPSLWICVKKDVAIRPGTLGCMLTSADKVAELSKKLLACGFNPRSFDENDTQDLEDNDIPVFTDQEGTLMRNFVELADEDRLVPETWCYDSRETPWGWNDSDWKAIQAKVEENEPLTDEERTRRRDLAADLQKQKLPHNMRHERFNLRLTPSDWVY